jgi:tagatose 1,6-diphosphate aldolase GatY/KbaY
MVPAKAAMKEVVRKVITDCGCEGKLYLRNTKASA